MRLNDATGPRVDDVVVTDGLKATSAFAVAQLAQRFAVSSKSTIDSTDQRALIDRQFQF